MVFLDAILIFYSFQKRVIFILTISVQPMWCWTADLTSGVWTSQEGLDSQCGLANYWHCLKFQLFVVVMIKFLPKSTFEKLWPLLTNSAVKAGVKEGHLSAIEEAALEARIPAGYNWSNISFPLSKTECLSDALLFVQEIVQEMNRSPKSRKEIQARGPARLRVSLSASEILISKFIGFQRTSLHKEILKILKYWNTENTEILKYWWASLSDFNVPHPIKKYSKYWNTEILK